MEKSYVFADSILLKEKERLQILEEVFDPSTQRYLKSTGVSQGWKCLEVGPGAGSIMRWMGEQVFPTGEVVALDINPRFIGNGEQPNITVRQADILTTPLEENHFDLAHARYVLLHIPSHTEALARMTSALKLGGYMVIEEPDFETAITPCSTGADALAVSRVNQAVIHLYSSMGIEPSLGRRLPRLFQEQGLNIVRVSTDLPLSNGGTAIAQMMKRSIAHLSTRLLQTNIPSSADIDHYLTLAEDPSFWSYFYTTVTVIGQKSAP